MPKAVMPAPTSILSIAALCGHKSSPVPSPKQRSPKTINSGPTIRGTILMIAPLITRDQQQRSGNQGLSEPKKAAGSRQLLRVGGQRLLQRASSTSRTPFKMPQACGSSRPARQQWQRRIWRELIEPVTIPLPLTAPGAKNVPGRTGPPNGLPTAPPSASIPPCPPSLANKSMNNHYAGLESHGASSSFDPQSSRHQLR